LPALWSGGREMSGPAAELARRLAREAEAVCRTYLANGRRQGGYWTVGDIHNTPGRSLYVRLKGGESGPGAAGKWTDAATGEHGDLLDLIARARYLDRLGDVLDEARTFLSLPRPEWISSSRMLPTPSGSPEAARRLFRAGRSLIGTPAESYLRARGITASLRWPSLRYHPSVNDEAGRLAAVRLRDRAAGAELEMFELRPVLADFNVDLCQLGAAALLRHLVPQLVPVDRVRFAPNVAESDAREARS
jgi:hypothetical protein